VDARVKNLRIVGVVVVLLLVGLATAMYLVSRSPSVKRGLVYVAGDTVRAGGMFASVMVVPRDYNIFSEASQADHMGVDLVLYDQASLQTQAEIPLTPKGREFDLKNSARLIGQDGKWLWVFGRSLFGVDLRSKRKVGEEELTQINPELARLWMQESRYYKIDLRSRNLVFSVGDGRKFRLEPETLKAVAYTEPSPGQALTKEEYAKRLAEYQEANLMFGVGAQVYFFSGEKIGEQEWVGLLTEEDLADLQKNWSRPGRVWGEGKRRRLYRLGLEQVVDARGPTGWKVSSTEALGGNSYLEGGLLRAERAAQALRLHGPEGYLVMHRFRLDGTLMLTRVDMTGKKLWEFDTEIKTVEQVLPGDSYLGLVAKQRWLYSVDLKQGLLVSREMP
jgi:hypothetical protein